MNLTQYIWRPMADQDVISSGKSILSIHPWYVTGFTDAEGSFSVSLSASSKYRAGFLVKLLFDIGLDKRDRAFYHSRASFVPIRSYSSSSPPRVDFVPERFYSNADTLKGAILKENKSKSGVYRFTNLINGKSYIGSAINLSCRFHQYYSYKFMSAYLSSRKSAIYSSLLKNGYSNFKLEILEYCKASDVIVREQFYITSFSPEYNLLKTAGSRFWSIQTVEAAKISTTKKGEPSVFLGKEHSEESKAKIREAQKGNKNSFYGKTHTEETKAKMFAAQKDNCQRIEVLDLETNETTSYASIREAARALSCAPSAILYSLNNPGARAYKGRYKLSQLKNSK